MALGPEQQKALYRAKLLSLVRSHFSDLDFSDERVTATGFASGATATVDGLAVVLIEGDDPARSLGQALVAARGAVEIRVLVDGEASIVARRAAGIASIVGVWNVDGTDIAAVQARRDPPPRADIPIDDPLVSLMVAEHADVLFEDGAVVGEILGVEVARIVVGHDGEARLDVGVGEYDQAAFALMNAGMTPDAGLAAVCAEIRKYRQPDAEPHPINRIARARWLRALLLAHPAAIGLERLSPVPALIPRTGIKEDRPVVAIGTDAAGQLVGVVCAVGLDLDLVPTAADAVWQYDLERVILVIPPRDRYALVDEMAALLKVPADIYEATVPWPT